MRAFNGGGMKSLRIVVGLMLGAMGFAGGYGLKSLAAPGATDEAAHAEKLPKDINADSRNRLPLPKREELDPEAQKLYDNATKGVRSAAGLRGPGGIKLHNPRLAVLMEPAGQYIRFDSKLGNPLTQVAMLITAREMNCWFEWNGHERQAREAGIPQNVIDAIKYRKPLTGIDEKQAAIIQLGREDLGKHEVSSDTFARALKALGKENLVTALAVMGYQANTALLLTAFNQQLPPGEKSLLPMP